MNNGRIKLDPNNANQYAFTDNEFKPLYQTQYISGITKTPLYKAYFSQNNINHLQNNIIKEVASCSNSYKIGRQDETNLIVIMRSMYLQYATNTGNMEKEIPALNKLVLDYCVHNIISNIKHYLFYLKDISKLPMPLEHSKYMRPDGLQNYKDIIDK